MTPEYATRNGLIAGIACYTMWGLLPIFFAALDNAGPVEIIAHRVVWSLLFCAILISLTKKWSAFTRALKNINVLRTLAIATILILTNWLTYVFDASLGYYINPLVTVVLAVTILKERVNAVTWIALGFGAAAVVVMTLGMGKLPWISLVLAFSFGLYGLMKSRIGSQVDSLTSLTIETLLATPFAIAFLIWITRTSDSTFTAHGSSHTVLLISTGIITALPLIFFGFAAQNLPLSTLGMLQYLGPTIQFFIALLVFNEPMPLARWIGFILVWVAILFAILGAARASRSVSKNLIKE